MPDVHWGIGATVGSVIPTSGAIVPASVGVDIGCGMMAVRTSLTGADLPDNLGGLRTEIERRVPHGRTPGRGRDKGSWEEPPAELAEDWLPLQGGLDEIVSRAPKLTRPARRAQLHLGTLGTGNHFIEVCLDEEDRVWAMLHSGSRGIGNAHRPLLHRAGQRGHAAVLHQPAGQGPRLPGPKAPRTSRTTSKAVSWAQRFAYANREAMMERVLGALRKVVRLIRTRRSGGRQLPPQLRCPGRPLQEERLGDPQGCGTGP